MLSAQLRFLDCKKIELYQDNSGVLKLRLDKNEECSIGKLRIIFPITDFGKFIDLYDEKGREIGVIEDYTMLSSASRRILDQELEKLCFIEIREIENIIEKEDGSLIWKVQTNKGGYKFEIMREMLFTRGRRVIIFSDHSSKFEIPNYEKLPRQSRKLFDKHF